MTQLKARNRDEAFLASQHDSHGVNNIGKASTRKTAIKHSFHMIVIQSFMACFLVMMLAYVMAFWELTEMRLKLAIAIGFLLIYITLPLVMLRFEHEKGQTIRAFLRSRIKICYGEVTGKDMVIQICLIPFMLCLCSILICITLVLLRP